MEEYDDADEGLAFLETYELPEPDGPDWGAAPLLDGEFDDV